MNESRATILDKIQVFTLSNLQLILPKISNSTAPSDVIPTRLCKIVLTNSPDYFIALINSTLQTGYFPNQFKKGVVRPLKKKSNPDPELLSIYRPVTNLRFLSKVIERVVFEQLDFYLESNNLMSKYQSAYRCSHSTETVLLKVFNDLLCYLDESHAVMYIGLDLSAAFDIIDHHFLFERLAKKIGLQSVVLLFIENYLSHRSQQVIINGCLSGDVKVKTGVLQGSVLVPLLFSCYMLPLEDKLKELGINYHFYANDTVLYFVLGSTLSQCMFDDILISIQRWFSKAKLKLNAYKSEYMVIRKCKIVKQGSLRLPEDGDYTERVKVLGCYIDCQFTLQRQFSFVCSNSFYYLRKVWSIRDQVKKSVLIELIRVLVLSRVDYCNSLYYGLQNFLLAKLQRTMNSAARLIFPLSPSTRTSSYLKQLHWLPIRQRIVFKMLLYAHRFIHQPGKLPLYLLELIKRNTMVTKSHYFYNLLVPKFRSNFGRRSFSPAVAVEWNKLSFDLKLIPSEILFRRKFRTYLF